MNYYEPIYASDSGDEIETVYPRPVIKPCEKIVCETPAERDRLWALIVQSAKN